MAQTSEARKVALLIGVDDYMNVPKLKCCVNDMKTLKEALMKIGFEENDIQILITGASDSKDLPTKRNIEKTISKFVLNAHPADEVFLALSGHGAQERKNVYFCPMDAEVEDLAGTCVSINRIMDVLANRCQAKFKWMVVDACRNDPTQGPKGIGGKGLQVIPTPPAGIALFQSCAEGEQSWEDYDSGNGFFTKNFAAALSGEADSDHDGKLTLMEVCKWTIAKTKEQVMNNKNKIQRPYFSGSVSDFVLAEDIIVLKAQKLVEEAHEAVNVKNYKLAIQKYDEAIDLCPRFETWKQERKLAYEILIGGTADPKPDSDPLATPGTTPGERRIVTINGVEFPFRWCPPGKFMMGDEMIKTGNEVFIINNQPYNESPHEVTLTNGFWMMETEVTQKQWKAIMGNNPSDNKGDDLPMYNVTVENCQDFCKKCKQLGLSVQLPTEAQWEYACRAGTTGAHAGNCLDMAWCLDNSGHTIHPVGQLNANNWGLYDMHGNVWEYCTHNGNVYEYAPKYRAKEKQMDAHFIVQRGGCIDNIAMKCRSASRVVLTPKLNSFIMGMNPTNGFRCVREITSSED